MTSTLDQLLADGVIDEVLSRLKSGKEADVWLVRHRDEIIAAKVYKDRATRSFKNSSGYKEGRAVRNTRTQRAMDRGSRFGQAAAEDAWKSAESDALHLLYAQGVRVPAPVVFYEGILLMELVLDEEGQPAPRLIDAHVPLESAGPLYEDLRAQVVKMLSCDLIHGDLSPYNVLLGAAGPTIIDFPQVVSAAQNSRAEEFFTRDVENLRNFFGDVDPAVAARKSDAAEIWRAYVKRDLAPGFVPTGRLPERREPHAPRQGQHEAKRHGGAPRPPGGPSAPGAGHRNPPAAASGPKPQRGQRHEQRAPRNEGPAPAHGAQPRGGHAAPRPPAKRGQQRHPGQHTPPRPPGQHAPQQRPPRQHAPQQRPPVQHTPQRPQPAPGGRPHGPPRHGRGPRRPDR